MRGLGRIQELLRPAPQHNSVPDNPGDIQPGADDVEVDCPLPSAAAATHPCLKLPIAVSRFVRRVVQRLRERRNGFNARREQRTSATSDVDVNEQCWCCHLANCLRGGMRRLVTSLTQPNTAESKCRTPECKWFKAGCTRIYLIIVNLASFIGGWLLIAFAVWLHVNGDSFFFWSLFRDNPTDPVIVIDQVPIIFAIVGLLFAITSFLGCCGACVDSVCFLGFYTVFLSVVIIVEVAVGILTTALSQQISGSLRSSMRYQISREYNNTATNANHTSFNTLILTQSWDTLQTKFNCCGIDGPRDYINSAWFNHTKEKDGDFVPLSCCIPVLRRSHYGISENKCQIDALLYPASINESTFLNVRGCHDSLVTWSEGYLQRLVGLPLLLVVLTQIVSLVLACALVKWVRRKHSDYWWYVTEECE